MKSADKQFLVRRFEWQYLTMLPAYWLWALHLSENTFEGFFWLPGIGLGWHLVDHETAARYITIFAMASSSLVYGLSRASRTWELGVRKFFALALLAMWLTLLVSAGLCLLLAWSGYWTELAFVEYWGDPTTGEINLRGICPRSERMWCVIAAIASGAVLCLWIARMRKRAVTRWLWGVISFAIALGVASLFTHEYSYGTGMSLYTGFGFAEELLIVLLMWCIGSGLADWVFRRSLLLSPRD